MSGSGVGFLHSWNGHADQPALITDRETVTYTELDARVTAEMGRFGGARRLVLMELQNALPAIVSYLAALRAGHAVLIASDRAAREALVERYDPDVVAAPGADDAWQVIERRTGTRHELHPDLALLLSTSGSTGSPKLVRLSYENLDSNAKSIAEYLGIRSTDRAMTSLPLSYCYGLSVLHSHLTQGAAVIVTGLSVVDAGFWDLARTAQATAFAGVPYTFDLLDSIGFADVELPSLRYITQAGGKLGADRVQRFAQLGRRRGWDLVVMYGQTEATARMAYLPVDLVLDAPEAVGVAIPGGRFTIDDSSELIYHGPNVMLGYAESPADFALGRTIDRLHTGDLARRRADGMYEIVGRRSRFLKLFGLRVDLDQLEHQLLSDGIQAMCTGDDTGLVVAVAKGTPDPAAVICAKVGLPAGGVRSLVLDELPRNVNGKPDYAAVMRSADASPDSAAESVVQATGVRGLYRQLLRVDDVSDTDSFVSLGGDSLTFVQTSQRLENLLGTLPSDWHVLTVGELEARGRAATRRPIPWMDTTAVLRAVAILLICSFHYGLTGWWCGAHLLLAVAGFNFARFQVNAVAVSGRVRSLLLSIARIAVPSAIVIGILYVVTDNYDIWNVLLVHTFVGPDFVANEWVWDDRWNFWFVEALLAILAVWTVLLSIPAVRRLERAHPFGFAMTALAVCLVFRFNLVNGEVSSEEARPLTAAWAFAVGWAAARATRVVDRLVLSVVALCGALLPGFTLHDNAHKAVFVGGLLLLVWGVTRVPVLPQLRRLVALVAGASLWIYLTHRPVYALLARLHYPFAGLGGEAGQWGLLRGLYLVIAIAIAVAVGVLAWKAYERALSQLAGVKHRRWWGASLTTRRSL